MATNENTASATCETCGSEIVWDINESNFNEGECGPCEYVRYQTQPPLVEAGKQVIANWNRGNLAGAVNQLREAINAAEDQEAIRIHQSRKES